MVGGYTGATGLARAELGALLLGHFDGDRLRYAGKVGTGFDRADARDLGRAARARCAATRRRSPTPAPSSAASRGSSRELVAQVGFTEWTRDGRLRHPRFLGLRYDKSAREVVREG